MLDWTDELDDGTFKAFSRAVDVENAEYNVIPACQEGLYVCSGSDESLGIDEESDLNPYFAAADEAKAYCQELEERLWHAKLMRDSKARRTQNAGLGLPRYG
jgi:hypothetical protein